MVRDRVLPLLLPCLLLAACTDDVAGPDVEDPPGVEDDLEPTEDYEDTILTIGDGVLELPINDGRSIVITDPAALREIEARRPLGQLLAGVGRAAITRWAPREGQNTSFNRNQIDRWVERPFDAAGREHANHNELPSQDRLGMRNDGNPWRRLLTLWPQLGRGSVGAGPFRLLAVVNRLDLAGDADERGIIDAAEDPRTIGEARLIFGLVDEDYERNQGKPYPMTLIIEFRLPALDASYNVIENFDYRANLFDDDVWRTQMQRWGKMWRKLSASNPDTGAFQQHLVRIVNRFARPDNFVALRANVELAKDGKREFELREWYILKQNNWDLIPRKPRDEPYACGDAADLVSLVDFFWDAVNGDLDMARLTPANPNQIVGYHVPRTVGNAPIAMRNPMAGCPVNGNGVPTKFEQKGDDGNGTARITAPFGRAKDDFVWKLPGAPEARRHAFAIRTCTGCHSSEAGIFGFHIAPRLAGQRSRLSSFLTGNAGAFSHGGRTYGYDEMAARKTWLRRASERDPSLQLFESLRRHDER